MGSRVIIYIRSIIRTGSGILKSIGRIHRHTGSIVNSQASFIFQVKKSRLKMILGIHKLAWEFYIKVNIRKICYEAGRRRDRVQ
jgi:hypothetical protein